MKVSKLIELLQKCNQNDEVAMDVIGKEAGELVADVFTFNDGVVFLTGFKSNLKN